MKYDSIIIGAGVSGMTTAALLGKAGHKTALIEASKFLGPTIRGFCRGSVYFDTGFHYAGMMEDGQCLNELFDYLDLFPYVSIVKADSKNNDYFIFPKTQTRIAISGGLDAFAKSLGLIYPAEQQSINSYLSRVDNVLSLVNKDIFSVVTDGTPIFDDNDVTLSLFLDQNFSDPVLKTILSMHGLLYGTIPEETSVGYHTIIAGGYYNSSCQIVGGGKSIVDGFEAVLNDNDVDLYCGKRLSRIDLNSNGQVQGVVIDSEEFLGCDNCVCSFHPGGLLDALPDGVFRPVYRSRLKEYENTLSAIVVYCLDNGEAGLSNDFSNIMLVNNSFPDMYHITSPVSERPMFISRSSDFKGNSSGISIICPCGFEEVRKWECSYSGKRSEEYYRWKSSVAAEIVKQVQKHCSDFFGDLEIVDSASPLTFRDYMNAPEGCLYGVKHPCNGIPLLPKTKIPGLYLTGQAIVTPGILGAMLSGIYSAGYVTGINYGTHIKI